MHKDVHIANQQSDQVARTSYRIQPKIWMGLVAVVLYVLLAAGLGNIVNIWFPTGSDLGDLVMSHFIPLPILIIGGLLFIKWAGWGDKVWRSTPAHEQKPKRKWLYAFPVLLLFQAIAPFFGAPWSESSIVYFIVVLFATVLVGIGEELYFRGILRVSFRAHHGAFLTLIATSVLFGAAHIVGEVFEGLPLALIVFQASALSLNGIIYFGVFAATGRLWIVMFLHFLTDYGLRLYGISGSSSEYEPGIISVVIMYALWALSVTLIVSSIRQDLRTKREKKLAVAK